jgi:hypothetical protein
MTTETTMKDCVKIYLPNGKVHKTVMTVDKIDDLTVTKIRQLFGGTENIQVQVEVDPLDKKNGMKQRTLILWGESLKNSYVMIEQY